VERDRKRAYAEAGRCTRCGGEADRPGLRICSRCAVADRTRRLASAYDLTPEEREAMEMAQRGVCAACGGLPGPEGLHVDHHHATGVVRALTCHGCNTAAGLLGDDADRARALATYLDHHFTVSVGPALADMAADAWLERRGA
jgi:hypothetical protein